MKKPLNEIYEKMVEVMHDLTNEPEMDSRMRIALFIAAQESIAKNMERLSEKDIEDYVYCATVLKLYQLLGKRAKKEYPIDWNDTHKVYYATKYIPNEEQIKNILKFRNLTRHEFDKENYGQEICVAHKQISFGGVWYARELDRREALIICGIDAEFQSQCAWFGLGGA